MDKNTLDLLQLIVSILSLIKVLMNTITRPIAIKSNRNMNIPLRMMAVDFKPQFQYTPASLFCVFMLRSSVF